MIPLLFVVVFPILAVTHTRPRSRSPRPATVCPQTGARLPNWGTERRFELDMHFVIEARSEVVPLSEEENWDQWIDGPEFASIMLPYDWVSINAGKYYVREVLKHMREDLD